MKSIQTLVPVLALALSGCMIGDPEANSSDEIIGGSVDTGDPSVVRIIYKHLQIPQGIVWSACTATVISPKLLLTAAHCTLGASEVYYNPNVTADPSGPGWIKAQTSWTSPLYDNNALDGHDVGLVVLASRTTIAPSPLGPAPAIGATVRAVGYGLIGFGTGDNNDRRTVLMPVTSQTPLIFGAGSDGDGTCHGDSGGPVFDQRGVIVGTTSYGTTADCHGGDFFSRVDANRPWIDNMVNTYAALP